MEQNHIPRSASAQPFVALAAGCTRPSRFFVIYREIQGKRPSPHAARGDRHCSRAKLRDGAPAIVRKESAIIDKAPVWSAASTCLTLFRFGK
jgi:hypothetical protein